MALLHCVLKPEKDPPHNPPGNKGGDKLGEPVEFQWVLTSGLGWCLRAEFPSPATGVHLQLPHLTLQEGPEPAGASLPHQCLREGFWESLAQADALPGRDGSRAFISSMNHPPFPSLIPLSFLKSKGNASLLFCEKQPSMWMRLCGKMQLSSLGWYLGYEEVAPTVTMNTGQGAPHDS
jgi:hypothetical protein